MSLTILKTELLKSAEEEVAKLHSEANKEKRRIISAAEKEAEAILLSAKEQAKKIIDAEKAEHASATQLHLKRVLSEAKEEVVNSAVDAAWQQFSAMAKGKQYEELLSNLIENGLKELGNKGTASLNSKDMQSAAAQKFAKFLSKKPIDCQGGTIISSADGKITINSTLEQIFEERKEELRKLIYAELFGAGTKKLKK